MTLCIMYECANVNGLAGISHAWTDSNGDVLIVILIQRSIEIVGERRVVWHRQNDTFAEWPWAFYATDERL